MTDREFMELALIEAEKAYKEGEIPIGALVVCDGVIVAAAHNEKEQRKDPTAHAEVIALRKAASRLKRWRLTGCTLYVTIEPCPMCAGALLNSRIDHIVYGADDALYGAVCSVWKLCDGKALNHQITVKSGVMATEAREIMDRFFSARRI